MKILKKIYEVWADGFEPHFGSYLVEKAEKRQKKIVEEYVKKNHREVESYLRSEQTNNNFWENFDIKMAEIARELNLSTGEVRRSFPKSLDDYRHILKCA